MSKRKIMKGSAIVLSRDGSGRQADHDRRALSSWVPAAPAIAALAGLFGMLTVAAPLPRVLADLGALPTVARVSGPDAAVAALAGAGCWAATGWLALSIAVLVAGRRPGRCGRVARAVAVVTVPPALRRIVAVGIGLTVMTSATGPAFAVVPAGRHAPPAGAVAATGTADPGVVADFDWPVDRGRPLNRPSPRSTVVVVQLGDSLWEIADRHLPPSAGPYAIARAWPRWYAANRSVIGPDPDLLRPGQRLVPPTQPSGDPS